MFVVVFSPQNQSFNLRIARTDKSKMSLSLEVITKLLDVISGG